MTQPLTDWHSLHGAAFQNARVLVTGGAGFIGSHLAEALVSLGAHVVVLDNLVGGRRENLAHLRAIEFIDASIVDRDALASAVRGCRYVFHQAALGSVPASINKPLVYHEINATGTLAVLEAARAHRVQRVTFAASSSAYGDAPPLPKVETMAPLPRSPYAASKVAAEALCFAYAAAYGLDTAPLRYFNIFGPRQSPDNAYAAVIAAFAKSLLAGEPPVIYGDGEQSRDFTFVHNAVHANLLAARCPRPIAGRPINVATGQRISVNQLATAMAQSLNKSHLVPRYLPERAGDVKHSLADLYRAKELLGYEPIVDFPTGLAATLDWYRSALA